MAPATARRQLRRASPARANTSRATARLLDGIERDALQPPSAGGQGEQDGGDEEQQTGQAAAHRWSLAKIAAATASAHRAPAYGELE